MLGQRFPTYEELLMKFIPPFGLGTFRLKDQVAVDSVRTGLELGYRHIDTAQIYGNEVEVGQAIADSGVARDELFVTTKVWTENLGSGRVISQPAREPAAPGPGAGRPDADPLAVAER